MITQSFREQLSKIVTFIFDNDKKFIKKFIINNLIKSGVSLDELIDIDLKNVFISDSLVFIKIEYFVLNRSSRCTSFFLKSDDVFDWVNSLKNKG